METNRLTKENILGRSNSYEILNYYLSPYNGGKDLKHNRHIPSPFREDGATPSFVIYRKGQDWFFKDHGGAGEQGSCFDLVMKLHNLDFSKALALINQDLQLGLQAPGENAIEVKPLPKRKIKKAPKVEIKKDFYRRAKNWTPEGLEFWGRFGITKLSLDRFEVEELELFSAISQSKGEPYEIRDRSGLMFSYKISDKCYKIYRPGQKSLKFLWGGEKPESYVFGLSQLPETGDLVIFTGGEKDVMTLHALGFHAISLNSETALPPMELVEELKKRFGRVASLYDTDKTGREQAKKLEGLGIENIEIPAFEQSATKETGKDISDYIDYGQDKELIKNLILTNESPAKEEKPASENVSKPKKKEKPLPKEDPKLPQRDNTGAKGSPDRSKAHDSGNGEHSHNYRNISELAAFYARFALPENSDFIQDGAELRAHYHRIGGSQYRQTRRGDRGKQPVHRAIGTQREIFGAYIPPALRDKKRQFLGPSLIICHREIDAYLLSELGIMAISISHPSGFVAGLKRQNSINITITEVLSSREIDRVIYLMPAMAFTLPSYEKRIGQSGAYESEDAARNAKRVLDALTSLQELFINHTVHLARPVETQLLPRRDWLEVILRGLISKPEQGKYLAATFYREITRSHKKPVITHYKVSTGSIHMWRKALKMDSVDSFFAFYGMEALGPVFTWGKNVYEYDHAAGGPVLKGTGREIYTVREEGGVYIGKGRGDKDRVLSTFTMEYILEIKEEEQPRYLAKFTHINGATAYASFTGSDILSENEFKRLVMNLPGGKFSFLGTKSQLEEIHSFSRERVEEAISLSGTLGLDLKNEFYVYGNGILTKENGFIEADPSGVVSSDLGNFYIAAAAEENAGKDEYRAERDFYFAPDGDIDFKEWAELYIKVHSMQGHTALVCMISALYRDIFRKVGYNVYPHFFIHGMPGSGKSSAIKHLYGFFGSIPETSLKAGATRASFDRKIEQFSSAILPINEMDVKQEYVKRLGLVEYFVGVYDFQGREKTVKGKSKQALPKSALFLIGQEEIWHKDALATRCVIQYYGPEHTNRTEAQVEDFARLSALAETGYSHLMKPFFFSRDLIKDKLRATVEELKGVFLKASDKNTPARLIENYAMTLAPLLVLIREEVIEYPLGEAGLIEHYSRSLNWQTNQMIRRGVLNVLLDFISAEYGPRKKFNHQNVFTATNTEGVRLLRLRLQGILPYFDSYVKRENLQLENTSKNDIRARIKAHPAFIREANGLQVGYRVREGGYIETNTSGKPVPYKPGSASIEMDLDKMPDFELPAISWVDSKEEEEPEKAPF